MLVTIATLEITQIPIPNISQEYILKAETPLNLNQRKKKFGEESSKSAKHNATSCFVKA